MADVPVELIRFARIVHDVLGFMRNASFLESRSHLCGIESFRQKKIQVVGDAMIKPAAGQGRSTT
jgi:hypothetical protein